MTQAEAPAYPHADAENEVRPETLEEAAGRSLLVSFDFLTRIDLWLLRILRTRGHARPIERVVLRYTVMGEHAAFWHAVAAIAFLLDRRGRAVYVRSVVAVMLTQAANFMAKNLIARARPLVEDLPPLVPTISGLSTPSAHASTSVAAAISLSEALPRLPVWTAALVMTLSRPYLGVHYPSDSLAGAALGALIAREVRRAHRTLDAR